jgi:hypothetical protein
MAAKPWRRKRAFEASVFDISLKPRVRLTTLVLVKIDFGSFFPQDRDAQCHTLSTNVNLGARNQFLNLVLTFAAKRAPKILRSFLRFRPDRFKNCLSESFMNEVSSFVVFHRAPEPNQ